MDLTALREEYRKASLDRPLASAPLGQLRRWMAEAHKAHMAESTAMVVVTLNLGCLAVSELRHGFFNRLLVAMGATLALGIEGRA